LKSETRQATRPQKIGKKAGCGICGCFLTIPVFVGTIIYLTMFSNVCARMMGEETYPITGEPTRFDPIAAIAEIKAKAGAKAVFTEMDATSVRADGTMDLNAKYKPAPNATYRFQVPLDKAPDGQEAPPIGAGRGPDDIWVQDVTVRVYEPGMHRHVTRVSGGSRSSYSYINEGMDVDRGTPRMMKLEAGIPSVKVSTKEMWEVALKLGAPKDAVARIDLDDDEYTFGITGTKINLRWDKDGKLKDLYLTEEQRRMLGYKDVDPMGR
jgi:hypothetical protein